MKATGILKKTMPRREARRIQQEFNNAALAATGITAYAKRMMKLADWEASRSPSRLGRTGERAEQLRAVAGPAALAITSACGALGAVMDLWERYERFNKRNQPKEEPKNGDGEPTE